ncbi:MAG: glycosyltransferase family 4 protein [Ruminococcaceae bacterium]|nr:glycosyltransferase family 4 protein [Oscillospiraceae bacterium]
MKILITTDLFTTETNGVVTSVKNLRDELEKRGHDVKILTLSENMHSHRDENVYYIRSMPLGVVYPDVRMPLAYRHRLLRELVRWKPDIIHSQCEFFTYQFALYISKKTSAPIVHTYHTLYEQYVKYVMPSRRLGKKVVRVLSRKRLKKASTVIAPTQKVEDALHGYGVGTPIKVVPSGISLDQHKIRIPAAEREKKRRSYGIENDDIVLINLGRLGTEKNLDELLRFFAAASKIHDNIKFLIVGDGPAKGELEALSVSLDVSHKVVFTGMVKPSEVQNYYQLGDIFVSASTSETQGLTYIEAAANGLPLLCRKDPCFEDVMDEGENGYTYEDEQGFLSGLEKMVSDEKWLERAKKKSEEKALVFDKKRFGDAVEDVYGSVVE